jgi:hypothetical protein
MVADRQRLATELASAEEALKAAQADASALAAAVARIASHLHDDDVTCPVCRTHFEPGALKLIAQTAATARNAHLAAAEERHANLSDELGKLAEAMAGTASVIRSAEAARATSDADESALKELEARLRADLPEADDLTTAAREKHRDALDKLASARSAASGDAARSAELTVRRDALQFSIGSLEAELGTLRQQLDDNLREISFAQQRLLASGRAGQTAAQIDERIGRVRSERAAAEAERLKTEAEVRDAAGTESVARDRFDAALVEHQRSDAMRTAAAERAAAVGLRWQEADLEGRPAGEVLEAELATLAHRLARISELDRERQDLAVALDVAIRDEELKELVASMEQLAGEGATAHPDDYEQKLRQNLDRAERAYNLTESTQTAIVAFSDKLRDEAREFSIQFLAPLNTLIDDFNEALLSRPGESVRLNAAYHVDRTKFDMGLHYRDPLDDAIFDTDLAPQAVLSEGQLAANGFSILCCRSMDLT